MLNDAHSDIDLIQLVFKNIVDYFLKISVFEIENFESAFKKINTIPKEKRFVGALLLLQAEVDNGGFYQLYQNGNGGIIKAAIEGFQIIGSEKLADLVQQVHEIYVKEVKKLRKFPDDHSEDITNKIERKFYTLCKTENFDKLLADFIRKNKEKFVS